MGTRRFSKGVCGMYCAKRKTEADTRIIQLIFKHFEESHAMFQENKERNICLSRIKAVPLQPQTRKQHRGVEQLVARQAHNLEVACSSLAPATIYNFSFWCLSYITYNSNTFFIYNIYLSYSFLGGSTKKNSCASLAQ